MLRQIDLCLKRNTFPPRQRAVIARHAVRGAVFTEIHFHIGNSAVHFRKVFPKRVQIARFRQRGYPVQLMAHIVPRLPRILNRGFQIFISRLPHRKQMVFLLQTGVSIQAVRHQQKYRIEQEQQNQQRKADDDIALQDPAGVQRLSIFWNHEQIERDKNHRQNPEHVPGLGEIFILHHAAHDAGGGIMRNRGDDPAHGVIAQNGAHTEPRIVFRRGVLHRHRRIDGSGQAV